MARENHAEAKRAMMLADLLCRRSRRRVKASFKVLWSNEDIFKYKVSKTVLAGEQAWLEEGLLQSVRRAEPQAQPTAPAETAQG